VKDAAQRPWEVGPAELLRPMTFAFGFRVTPQQLKKALIQANLEVYRTLGDEIVLADRPRENLILDSGVRVRTPLNGTFRLRLVVRAEQSAFSGDEPERLFERARELSVSAVEHGFCELGTQVTPMKDPADPERTLDTFYEVIYTREAATLDEACAEARFALTLEKSAAANR
jgi:hypothetical protein